MSREEKILLLQLILKDIRGNWGWDLRPRVVKALELAKELELKEHIDRIESYKEMCIDGNNDGRFFRCSCKFGGYEGMELSHNLTSTVFDKSDEFKEEIDVLTYPEYRFDDWGEYEKFINEY